MAGLEVFDENERFLVILTLIISFLSLAGSFLIIITYIVFKKVRNFAFKLVLLLSIADIILIIGNLFSIETIKDKDEEHTPCKMQSFLVNYGGLASILWTSVIAWCRYSATVLGSKNLRERNKRFIFFGYGVPLLMSLLPIITKQYGRAGFFCWIKNSSGAGDSVMRYIQFYIPLWIALIFNVWSYVKVVSFLKKYISTTLEIRFIDRLKYYPLVLVLCWTFASINKIYNMFGNESHILNFLHYALGGLQGFFNAIVFGTNEQVREIWRDKFCCCLAGLRYNRYATDGANKQLKMNEEMQQRELEMDKMDDKNDRSENINIGSIRVNTLDPEPEK